MKGLIQKASTWDADWYGRGHCGIIFGVIVG